jgi:hypothetical protein
MKFWLGIYSFAGDLNRRLNITRLVEHLDHFPIYVHGAHPTFSPGWRKLYYPVQLPFDYIVSRIPTPTRIHASMSTNDHEISAMNVATQISPEELQRLACTHKVLGVRSLYV